MFVGLHVKYLLFCPGLVKGGKSRQIIVEVPNMDFHENPLAENRAVPCGQTDRHEEDSSRSSQLLCGTA
jgi:hypothetical protein